MPDLTPKQRRLIATDPDRTYAGKLAVADGPAEENVVRLNIDNLVAELNDLADELEDGSVEPEDAAYRLRELAEAVSTVA